DVAATHYEAILNSGACVIDMSGYAAMVGDTPLLTLASPDETIEGFRYAGGIALAHAVNTMLHGALVALKEFGLNALTVNTYEAAGGFGKRALRQLNEQSARVLNGLPVVGQQVAYSVLPLPTTQNETLAYQLARLLGSGVDVSYSRARVPVFHGHTLCLSVVLGQWVDLQTVIDALNNQQHYVFTHDKSMQHSDKDLENDDVTGEQVSVFNVEAGAAEGEFTLWLHADSVKFCAVETALALVQRLVLSR
ncbi:MAG: Asd/ArgC dimerization domain-containing protein, partial [Pontibacterium sp.]